MNSLLISDLHLTDNPRDSYRWRLFDWLQETLPKHSVKYLWILGDLTQEKDRHPARLVNRVVDKLVELYRATRLIEIYIIRGNHDGIDPTTSYFRFLGKYPCIKFVETPFAAPFCNREVLMLPHTTTPADAWKNVEMDRADYVFMHATVKGAVSENGQQLDGVPAGLLVTARRAKIYSGDVHVPQKVKLARGLEVEYVGAPYPVKFGDKFEPRAILIEGFRTARSLAIPSIQRRTLTITPKDSGVPLNGLHAGDQVKVRIRLTQSEYGDWARLKKLVVTECTDAKVELCGLELEKVENRIRLRTPTAVVTKNPQSVLSEFCVTNKLSQTVTSEGTKLLIGALS